MLVATEQLMLLTPQIANGGNSNVGGGRTMLNNPNGSFFGASVV